MDLVLMTFNGRCATKLNRNLLIDINSSLNHS